MKYSIIIPTYNHLEDCLKPCIESILQYTDFSNNDIEIIVVANGCTDGTLNYLHELKLKNLIIVGDVEPIGYTKAINLGLKHELGRYIVLLNNDVELLNQNKNSWLDILNKPFQDDSNVGITGVHQLKCRFTNEDFLLFFCVMIGRELINKIGVLDEYFNPGYGEDTDYCIRARNHNFKTVCVDKMELNKEVGFYVGTFPIYHKGECTVHELEDWNEIIERNGKYLKEKYLSTKKEVSIVITTCGSDKENNLYLCINSIFKYTNFLSGKYELIIVANGCDDETTKYLDNLQLTPNVRVLFFEDKLGVGAIPFNIGFKESKLEYGIFINDDCILLEQDVDTWINRLKTPFSDSDVSIVGVNTVKYEPTDRYFMPFFCSMFRNSVFRKIGYLDEETGYGDSADVEFCHRVEDSGFKWVDVCKEDFERFGNTTFPLFHRDGGSRFLVKELEKKYLEDSAKNRVRLKERYGKKDVKYSIIIPTYNHLEDCLKPCIKSILQYTDFSNNDIEIIVVANGCTDGTKDYINQLNKDIFKILWVDSPLGYTKSINFGIVQSRGKYIVLMNNDTELLYQEQNKWLNMLVSPFKDEHVGITGPHMNYCSNSNSNLLVFHMVMIPRKVINEVGFLDETFNPGSGEDTDYCMKIRRCGYQVVSLCDDLISDTSSGFAVGDFPLYHKGGTTVSELEDRQKIIERNSNILRNRYGDWSENKVFSVLSNEQLWRENSLDQFINYFHNNSFNLNEKILVEIGCHSGHSTGRFLKHFKKVFAVDPWLPYETDWDGGNSDSIKKAKDEFFKICSGFENLTVYETNSVEASKRFLDKSVDVVYIDGHHAYDSVSTDILIWLPKIKDGSYITGHDMWIPSIPKAIHHIFVKDPDATFVDSSWVIKVTDEVRNLVNLMHSSVVNRNKIYDCFIFDNEIELLDVRLKELYDVVDKFILVENSHTHSNKPKPYHFEENKSRFGNYMDDIIHVKTNFQGVGEWNIQVKQRDIVKQILEEQNCQDNDIIIFGDADEIPRSDTIKQYSPDMGIRSLGMPMYCYYLNFLIDKSSCASKIFPYSLLKKINSINWDIRFVEQGTGGDIIENSGWHFTTLGGIDEVISKYEKYAIPGYDGDDFKDRNRVKEIIDKGYDYRTMKYYSMVPEVVNVDESFPLYIRNNIEKFINMGWIREKESMNNVVNLHTKSNKDNIGIVVVTCDIEMFKPYFSSLVSYTKRESFISKDEGFLRLYIVANGCSKEVGDYVDNFFINDKEFRNKIDIIEIDDKIPYSYAINYGIRVGLDDKCSNKYLILMNDDVSLLEQERNTWVNWLSSPFTKSTHVGITGPSLTVVPFLQCGFIEFFCAMIKREVFEKVGLIDEEYGKYASYCDDIDFACRVQKSGFKIVRVPEDSETIWNQESGVKTGNFPIYHKGGGTTGRKEEDVIEAIKLLSKKHMNELKLNLGCGDMILDGYINVDLYNPKANIRMDIRKLSFDDDSVSEIIAYHIIEHFDPDELPEIIKEWRRVLKPGGKLIVELPNIEGLCDAYLKEGNKTERYGILNAMYGIPKHTKHQYGYDPETIYDLFNVVEMVNVVQEEPTIPYKGSNMRFITEKPGPKKLNIITKDKMKNEELSKYGIPSDVTVTISTKDRYFTTLPLVIQAVATQTLKPKHLIIWDDGEHRDLRENPLYSNLFELLIKNGINWVYNFGDRKGQVLNHQRSLEMAKTNLIWRLDDDTVPEADVLEKLVRSMEPNVGAIGGLVIDPKIDFGTLPKIASNKIEHIYRGSNIQWFNHDDKEIKSVDHLYSSFLFRREAAIKSGGYPKNLSIVGHREETIFTYQMKREGWDLWVNPDAVTWHHRDPNGGIRSVNGDYMKDEEVFSNYLKEWEIVPKYMEICILDSGLGDHFCFKNILPEYLKKHKNCDVFIACCYNDVFFDFPELNLISISEAKQILGDISRFNLYKFCFDNNWKGSLLDAYRRFYLD